MKHITLLFTLLLSLWTSSSCIAQEQRSKDEKLGEENKALVLSEFDTIPKQQISEADFTPRILSPQRALWLSIIFPGAGQIYNRKLWKLPIVYGGFLGCTYGITWNQRYYKGYAEAYRDLVENSPNKSYLDYVPPGYDVEANRSYLENAFKNKKDFYRRNRDLSVIGILGVYLVSILDAYVDASLYNFDITPDVSMNVAPAVILDDQTPLHQQNLQNASVGLNWSVKF